MENIRNIFLEKIQPYTDTFNNLSTSLINTNVIGETLLALQKMNPSYTRANTKQFLCHYVVYYFQNEVIGETNAISENLITNTNGQWDGINGCATTDVVANDVINFLFGANDITSFDPGTWSMYSFVWSSK